MTTTETTKVNRGWFIKRLLLPSIVLVVLGAWGLIDATLVYPASGRRDASLKLRDYLQAAEDSRRLTQSFVQVDDPAAELKKLAAREGATGNEALSPMERGRLAWLQSLKTMWALEDEQLWIADIKRAIVSKTGDQVYAGVGGVSDVKHEDAAVHYRPRTAEGVVIGPDKVAQTINVDEVSKHLKNYWATAKTPSPLAFYDMPLQWLFTVIGFGGAAYLGMLYVRVAAKKYGFERETHTLILPGGDRVAAADLQEIDKRKWHKFYVTLITKDQRSHTLDLYRHDPLEDWVLAMESAAFPETQSSEGTRAEGVEEGPDALSVAKNVGHVAAMTYGGIKDGVFAVFLFQADALRAAGYDPAAYAQGEVLKAVSVALRDEGGWRQWLTATTGTVRGRQAKTVFDWFAEREATFKTAFSRQEPDVVAAVKADTEPRGEWYAVVVGRMSEEAARRTCDVLMDPPPAGFGGFAAVRANPPTIERFQRSVDLEAGMEIKGDVLVGRWDASQDDVETAGLKRVRGEEAAA